MADITRYESPQLIAATRVNGTYVYNHQDENIGTIEDVMLDKQSGRVAYAIMSFGGFLGMGERYHPLPWSTLRYDTAKGGYVVDLSKEVLEGAPSYARDEDPNWDDRRFGESVHDYYKAKPYWMLGV